ncbi:MAG: hypothetical protein EA379_06300 [Phycisphaerales bacterium]|nr:MAG: hypothetical protein EA379_06300 [Phycisphaerales bacterium]
MTGAHAKGVTFLEVVFSAALLSIAATTITSAFTFIERLSLHDEARLGAHEIAHRTLLQFMDDPRSLPPDDVILPLGRFDYRYLLREEILAASQVEGENTTVRHSRHASGVSLIERFQARLALITVDVYLDEDGRRGPRPIATLSRIYDPMASFDDDPEAGMRNVIHMFQDEPVLQQMLLEHLQNQMRDNNPRAPGSPGSPANSGQERRNR